jgi:hypothetical protein
MAKECQTLKKGKKVRRSWSGGNVACVVIGAHENTFLLHFFYSILLLLLGLRRKKKPGPPHTQKTTRQMTM